MRSRRYGEAFFADDRLAELAPLARILFLGLLAIADREGRLEDRPLKIKALVLPFDNADVAAMLGDLERVGVLRRYVVDGRRLIAIAGFLADGSVAYQRPHPNETASALPPPPTDNQGTPPRITKVLPGGDSIPVTVTVTEARADELALPAPPRAVFVEIPTRSGAHAVHADEIPKLAARFPELDVPAELRETAGYWESRPARDRWTAKGARTGLHRRLADQAQRASDRGRPGAVQTVGAPTPTVAELRAKGAA